MKMVEITYRSNMNELNKLNSRLERQEKALAKKRDIAEKLGVADWSNEDRLEWLKTVETSEFGFIVNKADVKKNGAWFDLSGAIRDVEETKRSIERAESRLDKAVEKLEEYRAEVAEMTDLQRKEELRRLEFEQEQKEWAKDGITLEKRYHGRTPSGKKFSIWRNSGHTMRSWHCFTLYIDGDVIFTSGEFWRAYGVIKNS